MPKTPTDETPNLIASDKVENTVVYDVTGDEIGSILNLMIDKVSGQVEYAVMQFNGTLSNGSDYYPVPWAALEYDEEREGYSLDVDKETIQAAPKFAAGEQPDFTPAYGQEIDELYGITSEDNGDGDADEEDQGLSNSPGPLQSIVEFVEANPVVSAIGSFALGLFVARRRYP